VRSALALVLVLLAGCSSTAGEEEGLTVVTSSHPLEFVAAAVAGDRAVVENLLAPGADSHDADVSTRQLASLVDADLVVHLSTLQPAVDDVLASRPPAHLVDAARHADLGDDPHFWLDPTRLARLGHDVAAELSVVDPAGAEQYRAAADALDARLSSLDDRDRTALTGCEGEALVTSHEAFGYLAQRYGLRQVGIAGVDPSVEPSPARLRDVIAVVRENSVSTIFFEATANPAVAELLATDLGVRTAVLHPVERVEAGQDYLSLMEENLGALSAGLDC
jgi:zinc transport system substrate-binding protein